MDDPDLGLCARAALSHVGWEETRSPSEGDLVFFRLRGRLLIGILEAGFVRVPHHDNPSWTIYFRAEALFSGRRPLIYTPKKVLDMTDWTS